MRSEGERGGGDPFASVIVPVLNEARRIEGLAESLLARSGLELIVVDGGSRDKTLGIASSLGVRTLVSPRGRALQMNAGAAAARGRVLIFLHADTTLPVNFKELIHESLKDPSVIGGSFRFSSDDESGLMRFVAAMANFRSERMGIVFGDQAIFCRAEAFMAAGGFPEQMVMEDFELVKKLRRLGRFRIIPANAVTSARRWHEVGRVRNTVLNVVLTWAYIGGVSPERLHRWHRQGTAWGKSA